MTTSVSKVPLHEKLKIIPGFFGIRLEEEPKYFILFKKGPLQVRKYNSLILAQTFVRGDYEYATNEGFFRLTNYLFGSNSLSEVMSMSTPVIQGRSKKLVMSAPALHEQKTDGWMMSFIVPTKYKFDHIPRPLDENVEIIKVPSLLVASIRYSGSNNEQKIAEKTKELLSWLNQQEDFTIVSEPRIAQFDPPYVLSFLRRNEIQITVMEVARPQLKPH